MHEGSLIPVERMISAGVQALCPERPTQVDDRARQYGDVFRVTDVGGPNTYSHNFERLRGRSFSLHRRLTCQQ